jgi:hypothetical protein
MQPMPIIVGFPRSGTTLLRMMLDAHPELAIPPETGFLAAVTALGGRDRSRERVFDLVTNFPPDAPAWRDFGISDEAFREELDRLPAFTPAEGVRCFYRLYARRFGKPRYGDKTPDYAAAMPAIGRLLPEAAFIHVIRDGRDAALSLRPLWFSPGSDMRTLAAHWRDKIRVARRGAAHCARYLEVRYERLVTETVATLKEICGFLDLRYEDEMSRYDARAPSRLAEHRERVRHDGTILVTRERRLQQQWRTTTPPDATRIGQWRTAMTPGERREFEEVAGPLLRELGYGG